MNCGVVLALTAYGLYACSDAINKALGQTVSVFVIGFFITLFALIPMAFARPHDERWRDFWRMRHPVALHIRTVSGIAAGLLGIYAFTHLPLAEVYTLIFLMPFFVTLMSIFILKEEVGWRRWLALVIGLAGVIVAIRPGFREVVPAHLAGVGVALCGATTFIILRRVSGDERRTSLLAVVYVYALAFNGLMMTLQGFRMPSLFELMLLAATGILAGTANLLIILATRQASASLLAPTQYSQLIWGVALGALLFSDFPDWIAMLGLAIVAASGLVTLRREHVRGLLPARFPLPRNRF